MNLAYFPLDLLLLYDTCITALLVSLIAVGLMCFGRGSIRVWKAGSTGTTSSLYLHTTWEIAWSKFDVIKILNILVVSFAYGEASYKMYENLFILVLLVIYYILPKTKMGKEMNSPTPSVVV